MKKIKFQAVHAVDYNTIQNQILISMYDMKIK